MHKLLWIAILFLVLMLHACDGYEFKTDGPYILINQGIDIISYGDSWVDEGASLIVDGKSFGALREGEVGEDIGMYEITYSYIFEGKQYKAVRMVFVVDNTPPIGSLIEGIDSLKVGEQWVDAGVIAEDNVSGKVVINVSHTIDIMTPGTYVVKYQLTDDANNVTYLFRYVTVYE